MIIRSRSPVRLSFAGGGTDVTPYTEEHGGCAVSATINKYAWASIELRKDKEISLQDSYTREHIYSDFSKLEYGGKLDLLIAVLKKMHNKNSGINLRLRGDIPPRSGLGSSASAFCATIGVFNHMLKEARMTDYEIAEMAYDLERDELGNLGGRQDQYATVFGGFNFIEFKGNDNVRVNPIKLRKSTLIELEKNLVLVHVMDRKKSGDILKDQVKSYVDGKNTVVDALNHVKGFAQDTNRALRKGDLNWFGDLLHEGWIAKKKFSPMISNDYIDKIYSIAKKNGAVGGKVLGAGGGGHMILYCEPGKEEKVKEKVEKAGSHVRSFSFDMDGLQTWEV